MPSIASDEWVARYREATAELPPHPGASACIQYELDGGPDGSVTIHLVLEDGRVVGGGAAPADDPDFTMQLSWRDFLASLGGSFDPVVGFMRGEVKVVGNIGRMLSVLPVTTSASWVAAGARVAASTDELAAD